MSLKVEKVPVWTVGIEDRPGATVEKLKVLAKSGVNLRFAFARRQPDQPGTGVLFVTPIKGKKQEESALAAGFSVSDDIVGVMVEGGDKPGMGGRLLEVLAEAGINLRGFSAISLGTKFKAFIAFDNSMDADQGADELKKIK